MKYNNEHVFFPHNVKGNTHAHMTAAVDGEKEKEKQKLPITVGQAHDLGRENRRVYLGRRAPMTAV